MTIPSTKDYADRQWQTVALLGLIALSVVGYIFLTYLVVFHAVNKQSLHREIASMADRVTALEGKRLALDSRITLDLAYKYGFRDAGIETSYTTAQNVPLGPTGRRGYAQE